MTIKKYNPERTASGDCVFFIQSHGLHAGRPLKKPIPNSWQVETHNPNAFALCFMLYTSKILKNYLRGSVIPFLSLHEYKKIILPIVISPKQEQETVKNKISALYKIDDELQNLEKRKYLYHQLKLTLSNEVFKTFKND